MSFCSLASQRGTALLAAVLLVSACTENGRQAPLSQVNLDPPPDTAGNQAHENIDNPTLDMPATSEVSPGDTLTLVWSDEFDGADLDPEVWFYATGDGTEKGLPGGWGNNELQYYLPDSAQLDNGVLTITARQEQVEGLSYSSARINTEDRFAFRYGRIEASIKLPSGQGLWPAFWMLPQDTPYGDWAASGEIDIMETVNLDGTGGNEIFGTLHFGGEFPQNTMAGTTYTPSTDVTGDFHTYALEWDATEIRWYFDDTLYAMQNAWSSTAAAYPAPFDQPFHILLNLAVGGNFPGSPDGTTVFPATMEVDWVRVYSGEDGTGGGGGGDTVLATFDEATPPAVTEFGGAGYAIESGPAGGDGNALKIVRDGGDNFAGAWVAILAIPNDAGEQTVSVLVHSPTAGIPMVAKAEFGDNQGTGEVQANEAVVVGWQTLTWTFTNLAEPNVYNRFTLLPNLGTVDTATSYYFDNITLLESTGGGGGGGGDGTFVNGDFETGDFTGWTLTQIPTDRGSIALDSSGQGGRAGSVARLVAAGDAAGTSDTLISQVALAAGMVAPGDSIDVSFDLYGSLTGAGGVVFVEVIFLNAAGEDLGGRNFVGPAAPYVPSTTWTPYSGTVIAGTAADGSQWDVSGGVTLELKAACGAIAGGCGVDASFDNVTFTIN